MSYILKVSHHRPIYRRGDLEDETVIISVDTYKTRREAKEHIERKLKGQKVVTRDYRKTGISSCAYWTGKTWIHENSGETCEEYFHFQMYKA